jgi:hypothetical protein
MAFATNRLTNSSTHPLMNVMRISFKNRKKSGEEKPNTVASLEPKQRVTNAQVPPQGKKSPSSDFPFPCDLQEKLPFVPNPSLHFLTHQVF